MRLNLDLSNGTLSTAGAHIRTAGGSPGWLTRYARSGTRVYVANEDCPGTLQAYASDPADGALEPLGEPVSSVGRAPCYAALDVSGRWCFAANYVEGSIAVCPVLADGSLGPATDSKHHQGADEIDEALHDRQEGSHCHCVLVHPSNQWVIACDLGLSAVFVYGFDARRGTLSGAADDPRHLRLSAEAGCRHACWNATGTVLFVNNELTCSVTVAHFDVATGRLVEHQTVAALPPTVTPDRGHHCGGSDIALHPNGRFLYAAERSASPGLLAIFAFEPTTASLKLLGHESTRGKCPRNFKLLANGAWLVVGNQESKTIASFAVDAESGKLTLAHELKVTHKPCNIASPLAHFA